MRTSLAVRFSLLVLSGTAAFAQGTAPAPASGDPVWSSQQAGPLKWAQTVVAADFSNCGGAAVLAAQERDPALEAQMQTDASGYSCYLLGVRNDTAGRIQCQARLEQPYGDRGKTSVIESGIVLEADSQDVAIQSFGPTTAAPRAVVTRCFEIPAQLTPYKDKKECRGTINAPSPQRYYPPESRARLEEGSVIVEYGIGKGSTRPQDIRVVQSSGFAGIDTAAMRVMYDSDATHRCPKQRYRTRIVFRLADSPLNELTGGG